MQEHKATEKCNSIWSKRSNTLTLALMWVSVNRGGCREERPMKAGREKSTKLFLLSAVAVLAHTLEGVVSSECGRNVKLSVAMSSIAHSTVNCNTKHFYLTKTFVVETLYYCSLLCYVKCSTSLLTFKAAAMSLYHIKCELRNLISLHKLEPSVSVPMCLPHTAQAPTTTAQMHSDEAAPAMVSTRSNQVLYRPSRSSVAWSSMKIVGTPSSKGGWTDLWILHKIIQHTGEGSGSSMESIGSDLIASTS